MDRSELAVEWCDDCLDSRTEQDEKTAHLYVMEEYADEII